LDGWIKNGRLFQVKKPQGKKICYDGRDEILKALSCSGQKVTHINVNAIYPESVDAELIKIFSCLLDEALDTFLPKVDEGKLSSLLEAIEKVKGDVDKDNHSIDFWKSFGDHAETLATVKVLKPLSEDAFKKAMESFQNNRVETVKATVASWEAKHDVLYSKIQKEFCERIDAIVKKQFNKLRKKYSVDDISDISSGEQKLKQLQEALESDLKKIVMKPVKDDSAIKSIIDRDPESNKDVFEETRNRFEETNLEALEEDFISEIKKMKDLARARIEGLRLQKETREKMDQVQRLSDQIEEERREKERLNREISTIRSRSADNSGLLALLMTALTQQCGARERSYAEGPVYIPEMYERHTDPSGFLSAPLSSSSSSRRSMPSSPGRMTWGHAQRMYSSGRYTQKEIGKMMGCSQSTVSRHFRKGKK